MLSISLAPRSLVAVWTIPVRVTVAEGDFWTGVISKREAGTRATGVLAQPTSVRMATVAPISVRRRGLADIHETALRRLPESIDIFPACHRQRDSVRQFFDQ
ncbi:hypothetical protein NITLEN_40322 [Nitrospira lenta]|uniref:Uncharacterized protein n=1 Tax=Nitrospira lenta TaxID=1436998 RepID=A0A330L9A4_9BACT|nr:hypothetical protein NITLEN_40322 [Nitrospira lenta]